MSGKNLIADFVEEVQVKSSGYTAEFGGATGGVINVITKSGTNNWHGQRAVQLARETSCPADRFRRERSRRLADQHRRPDAPPEPGEFQRSRVRHLSRGRDATAWSPGSRWAARSCSNRAWFFGAYQPALTTTTRTVNATTAQNPTAGTNSIEQKTQVQYATGNLTSQLSDSLRARVWPSTTAGRARRACCPRSNGTDPADANYAKTSTFPN